MEIKDGKYVSFTNNITHHVMFSNNQDFFPHFGKFGKGVYNSSKVKIYNCPSWKLGLHISSLAIKKTHQHYGKKC